MNMVAVQGIESKNYLGKNVQARNERKSMITGPRYGAQPMVMASLLMRVVSIKKTFTLLDKYTQIQKLVSCLLIRMG